MSGWFIRLAAARIPPQYRDEIVADLQERHRRALPLLLAVLRSARDARRHMTTNHESASRRGQGWGSDLRAAWKQHRAHPAGAAAVVLILATAIGLNTALFSMVRGVLLRPLPFAKEERVAFIWSTNRAGARQPMAPARALDLGRRSAAIESAALIGHISMNVTGIGAAERWFGASVSSTFFDVLQAPVALGRTFSRGESNPDVVVLSHRLWQQKWHGDRSVIGTSLVMNGRPRQVIGVMPADFYWPSITAESSAIDPPLFWTCAPVADVPERPTAAPADPAGDRRTNYVRLVARLKPGVSLAEAQSSVESVAAELGREFPATDGGTGAGVVGAREQMFGPVERPMLFIWLASAIVVLGACVNVGTLILVRQAGRRREFAVRSALGATRGRLARLLISESVILALAGGAAGVVVAMGALQILVSAAPPSVGRLDQISIDGMVLAVALALSLVTGVLLGGLSAANLWRDRSADDLRGAGTAEPSRSRARKTLVGIEAGLAVLLVVVAALFGESLVRLYRVDVGFDEKNLLTFNVAVSGDGADDPNRQSAFFDRLLTALRAIPGVTSAGAAVTLPIGGDDFGGRMYAQGRPLPPSGADQRVGFQVVEPGWFQTLGLPLVEGRDFRATDNGLAEPAVILNRALADSLFPGQSAVGQHVRSSRAENATVLTVIGVVGSIRHNGPAVAARPEFYRPFNQVPFSFMAIALRTAGPPASFVDRVRAAIAEIDSSQPISGVSTMEAHLERAYGRARFLASLTLLFGTLALVLAVMGVYGVTSFSVTQRSREFSVRMALGASPSQLVRDVLTDSLRPVLIGAAVGLASAVAASSAARALLFGTPPTEVSAYLLAVAVLVATAAVGSLIPARRAARVDPVRALRDA
jgi:putative ABC transport system permease protein